MLPTSLSLSEQSSQALSQANKTGGGQGGTGLRSSVVNTFGLDGATVTSGLSADGTPAVQWYVWVALAAGMAGFAWWMLKRK